MLTHSPRTGIIPWISEAVCPSIFAAGSYLFSAQSGYLEELHPELDLRLPDAARTVIGSGCSRDPELAMRKAVFELLERYAATVSSPREVRVATPADLGKSTLSCQTLPLLFVRDGATSPWQPQPFDVEKPIRWIRGYELCNAREIWTPLIMVHTHVRAMPSERFWPQTTTGIAAHESVESALIGALYEIVERDAVETIWMTRCPLRMIRIDGCQSEELNAFIHEDQLECIQQRYFDATTDLGIPTVYAVRSLSPPIGHDVIVTCASHLDIEQAMLKARQEAAGQEIMRIHQYQGSTYSRFANAYECVEEANASLPNLSFLNYNPSDAIEMSALRKSSQKSLTSELRWIVAQIAQAHESIIVFNLTTVEMQGLGIHVIRVVIPTLMTVAPSENQKFLRHERLRQVAEHFNLEPPDMDNLNFAPQPFG